MFRLNNRDCQWSEGLTIERMMESNNFIYSRIIVSINDKFVSPEDYATTVIHVGDDVKAMHLLAGG